MINIQAFFNSLLASWIKRILRADPNKDNWVQLPIYFLKVVDIEGLNLRYNFDNSVVFPEIAVIPKFYKKAFKCYNMAFVSDKIYFKSTIMNQSLWGNKFITHNVGCKKNVLFLRNWIRSGVRKVGDLTFTNGVLDERSVYHRIICKRNIHCEIMLVRKALSPYQQSLRVENNGALCTDKPMRSKDFYNVFRSQISEKACFTRISNYLASYCEPDEEIYAFSNIIIHEKEIKLKEFNFKVLRGILPCNRNLMRWKIRHDDKCDVCGQTQSIEHLLYSCRYVKPVWQVVNTVYGINVNFKQILGLDEMFSLTAITTIISFFVYKEWLLLSLKDTKRNPAIALSYFKNELNLRIQIYEKCTNINTDYIQSLKDLEVCL